MSKTRKLSGLVSDGGALVSVTTKKTMLGKVCFGS
jgi:hypothetical protein